MPPPESSRDRLRDATTSIRTAIHIRLPLYVRIEFSSMVMCGQLSSLGNLQIEGFEASRLLSNDDVKELVRTGFNSSHLDRIAAIRYVDKYQPTLGDEEPLEAVLKKGLFVSAAHKPDLATNRAVIEAYRQDPRGNSDAYEMKRGVVHELAFSVFEHLSAEEHDAWNRLDRDGPIGLASTAAEQSREDFCRYYALFVLQPDRLRDRSPEVLAFILSLQ